LDHFKLICALATGMKMEKFYNGVREQCVCVYLSSGFKGQCFNYSIPFAKSYPLMTSLPYLGLVVLPLPTPGGAW